MQIKSRCPERGPGQLSVGYQRFVAYLLLNASMCPSLIILFAPMKWFE